MYKKLISSLYIQKHYLYQVEAEDTGVWDGSIYKPTANVYNPLHCTKLGLVHCKVALNWQSNL